MERRSTIHRSLLLPLLLLLLLLLPSPRAEPRYRHRGVNRSNLSMDTRPIRYLSIRLDKRTACAEDNRFARNYAGIRFNVRIYIYFFSRSNNSSVPVPRQQQNYWNEYLNSSFQQWIIIIIIVIIIIICRWSSR